MFFREKAEHKLKLDFGNLQRQIAPKLVFITIVGFWHMRKVYKHSYFTCSTYYLLCG